jgi:hypothetical protein
MGFRLAERPTSPINNMPRPVSGAAARKRGPVKWWDGRAWDVRTLEPKRYQPKNLVFEGVCQMFKILTSSRNEIRKKS